MFVIKKNRCKFIKKEIRLLAAVLLSILFSAVVFVMPMQANQTDKSVGFSVSAIQSDKQINNNVSYFDIMLSPEEEHVLEVDIFNNDDEELNVTVASYTAGTNSGGVIDYDNPNVNDDSLVVSFAEITDVENPLISIGANSSARAKIKLKMPNISFDGIMLGGIVVKKLENAADELVDINATSLENEYCYVIGVKIGVNDSVVEPDFRLRYVKPALSNYHTSIAVNFQNYKAAIAKGVKIEANVYRAAETQPLYTGSNDDFDIAPNSNFDYIIPCSGKLPSGDYRLALTATHGEKVWEFEEKFTITEADAESINSQAVNKPAVDYYRVATICLSVLLIVIGAIFAVWFIISRRKKKSE